jgi:hypothetical protein
VRALLLHYWGTTTHKARHLWLTVKFCARLTWRSAVHDLSKYRWDESRYFVKTILRLRGSTYGSDEYKGLLAELKPALDLHYARHRHHPEHSALGIGEMSLTDVAEMFLDWHAATHRHRDGSIVASVEKNEKRFGLSCPLYLALWHEAGGVRRKVMVADGGGIVDGPR